MTTLPQSADPTKSYTATYDAWNRLVKIVDGANTVADYAYDGRKFRIVSRTYTAGVLSEVRHHYYTAGWQCIEERLGTTPDTANPNRQFVWGRRYIDDLVERDRDTDGGTLSERLYGLQDANWNMVALSNTTGAIQERYACSPYGQPVFLTATFTSRTLSSFAWERLFCGYQFDAATALYNIRHRVYHPGLGTWVQRDPIRYASGQLSIYGYVHSSPSCWQDPDGLRTSARKMCLNITCSYLGEEVTCVTACGPICCARAKLSSDAALKAAEDSGLPGLTSGMADAYRHCVWSCLMARNWGAGGQTCSKCVGDIHEKCNPPKNKGDDCMDLYNNQIGYTTAYKMHNWIFVVDCKTACRQLLDDGTLQTSPGCPGGA